MAGQREVIKTFLHYKRKLTYYHWHTWLNFFSQIEDKISIFFAVFNGGTEIYFSFFSFLLRYRYLLAVVHGSPSQVSGECLVHLFGLMALSGIFLRPRNIICTVSCTIETFLYACIYQIWEQNKYINVQMFLKNVCREENSEEYIQPWACSVQSFFHPVQVLTLPFKPLHPPSSHWINTCNLSYHSGKAFHGTGEKNNFCFWALLLFPLQW